MKHGRIQSELRLASRLAAQLLLSLIAIAPVATVGAGVFAVTACNGLNIVTVVTQLSTYVTAFIQVAETVWATLQPLLGSNAATANAAFNDAIVALQNANALMMDGEQAYEAGKTVNLPQLMQAVQDAVQRVMDVIQQFQSSAPAKGYAASDSMQTLSRMATSIQHWQVQR